MDTKAIRQNLIDKIKTSLPDDVIMDMARLVEINEEEIYIFTEEERKLVYRH